MVLDVEQLHAATGRPEDLSRYLNRELSLLDFQDRLLDLAEDERLPLLERVKFLAIFSTGIDELFEVRVAGLKDRVAGGLRNPSPDGRSPIEQLRVIRAKLEGLLSRQSRIFLHQLVPALADAGVGLLGWESLGSDDRRHLDQVFERQIFPVLTPLAVDTAHPFPYISNLSLNLAVTVGDPLTREQRFARVKVPPLLPRFVALPDGERFVPVEQVIAAHLDALFPEMTVDSHYSFRVTRNADLTLEEGEADDLLVAVEMELRRRRFGRAVRLEIDEQAGPEVRELLTRELELGADDVYDIEGPLDLGGLMALYDLDRGDLRYEPWAPMTQPRLATAEDEPVDLFAVLRERDVLVHHPYDSFATSVEAFVAQAAGDPSVQAIKQTLYRTSGHSPIVRSLIKAAEQGKQVAVLVELKARGDEQANIAWARALEEVGVHVVYGLVGLKTHAKAILVVRAEEDGLRRYCHVGTGNYNSKTASLYEDLGLLSTDPDLGADLTDLFNFLTGYSRRSSYRRLVVAPTGLRARVIDAIQAEAAAGVDGRIVIKCNGLTDPAVIDSLYEASEAGVPIDLLVRGVCRLRPGVPGLSETIHVRSVVGRFLEHSRIFHFGGVAGRPAEFLIGSADLMERNLDRRIEAVVPVLDEEARQRLSETLDLLLADDTQAWGLGPDGAWTRVAAEAGEEGHGEEGHSEEAHGEEGYGEGLSAQRRQQELAVERARRRRRETERLSPPGG